MKRFLVIATLFLFFGLTTAAIAGPPCPPGAISCSENHSLENTPIGMPFTNDSTATKKKAKKNEEQRKAHQQALLKASKRDHDLPIKFFPYNSKSDYCDWRHPVNAYGDWLLENSDVIVDRKDYLETYRTKKIYESVGAAYGECTTTLVVHYHKKSLWKFWE